MKFNLVLSTSFLFSFISISQFNTKNQKAYWTYDTIFNENKLPLLTTTKDAYQNILKKDSFDFGKIISSYEYLSNGNLLSRKEYKYTNNSKEIFRYNNSDKLTSNILELFDSNNNLTQISRIHLDGSKHIFQKFTYDSSNSLLKKVQYKSNDSIEFLEEYSYNNVGNLIDKRVTNKKYNLITNTKYEYDSLRKKIKQTNFGGENTYYHEYKYNEENRLTEKISSNSTREHDTTKIHKEYIDEKEIIKTTLYNCRKNNDIIQSESFYDLAGNKINSVQFQYKNDGKLSNQFERKFDKKGNDTMYSSISYNQLGEINNIILLKKSFDNKGNLCSTKRFENEKIRYSKEFIFDSIGNSAGEEINYDYNGKSKGVRKYKYKKSYLIEDSYYYSDGRIKRKSSQDKILKKRINYYYVYTKQKKIKKVLKTYYNSVKKKSEILDIYKGKSLHNLPSMIPQQFSSS